MTIAQAKELIKRKYSIDNCTPDSFSVNTNIMVNQTSFAFIMAEVINDEIFLTDHSKTIENTIKSKEKIKQICTKNGLQFNEEYADIQLKLTCIEDVDNFLDTIQEIILENGEIPEELWTKRHF